MFTGRLSEAKEPLMLSRREFGKLTLASLPAATVLGGSDFFTAFAQGKPNSKIEGVQLGTITYSYRSMTDQSAEATLRYILDSGISAIELMGGPIESFAGIPTVEGGRGGGGGRGRGGPGEPGGRGGRGERGAAPAELPPGARKGAWKGTECVIPAPGAARGGGGGGGRGRGEPTAEQQAAEQAHAAKVKAWRTSVSMDPFKKLRKMYNDAGVTIYATKMLNATMSDEEFEYVFNVAEALGANHTTLELLTDDAQLKRVGDFAMKKKIYAAYHTHAQGSMTAFDKAFALSKGNKANVDFGHWVAAGNVGGTPMQFLEKYHDRIGSFHLKDRTTPDHCSLNIAWGTGETPIREILQLVKKNKWDIPASIELEYNVPEGSDAVKEVKKCVDYCRAALTAKT
jgi:sugar phosphate isomerase/epimerase